MDPFIGQICLFGFNFAPRGWAQCNGQLLPISQYQALFSLLGTTYGGNGVTTFGLPDLRGRVPMHLNGNHPQGQIGGAESATLNVNQLPPHNHPVTATGSMPCASGAGTSDDPVGKIPAGSATDENYAAAADADGAMAPLNVSGTSGVVGSGAPVPTLPPFQVMNFCIALEGIFPSRP
jgi:microcystin-dependent protein